MKVNPVLCALVVIVAALLGYAVYAVAGIDPKAVIAGVFSAICFMTTLVPAFGLKYQTGALSVNLRALSIAAFMVMLTSHFTFAAITVKMPYYIIVNGILLCVFLAIIYSIASVKDV